MEESVFFADADISFDDADFVIVGVPIDFSCCHRKGAHLGPSAIRKESWNFETFLLEYQIDLEAINVNDFGDLQHLKDRTLEAVGQELTSTIGRIVDQGKFPIVIGGEHSISSFVVAGYLSAVHRRVGIISIDAHLDFRPEYLDEKHSHACSTRRLSDIVGVQNIIPLGIRSMSKEEYADAQELGLTYFTAAAIRDRGIDDVMDEVLELLAPRCDGIYLTIDIDGLDPAFAPAVGTPEPFGLNPLDVSHVIERVAPRLIGVDVVEVSPPYDTGNTAALAARYIRNVIGLVHQHRSNDS